jgi:hypothetical protein
MKKIRMKTKKKQKKKKKNMTKKRTKKRNQTIIMDTTTMEKMKIQMMKTKIPKLLVKMENMMEINHMMTSTLMRYKQTFKKSKKQVYKLLKKLSRQKI